MKVDFKDEVWNHTSKEAQDLIKKMLTDPDSRISLDKVLEHPWMTNQTKGEIGKITTKILRRLSTFKNAKVLKKAALMFIVSNLPAHKLEEERKEFMNMDVNKDGYISLNELESAVQGMKDRA